MAGSLNRAQLLGNVGKDPEVRTTQGGKKIVNLTLATSETWTDKSTGERKDRTEWHRIVCFNEQIAGVIEKYVKKGSKIMVEGQIVTRKWTDQSGVEKYTTEIVIQAFGGQLILLGDRAADGGAGRAETQQARPAATTQQRAPTGGGYSGDIDDEIPF